MSNMSMDKPMGISSQEYKQKQAEKSESDFKSDVYMKLNYLDFAVDQINSTISQMNAGNGSLETETKAQLREMLNSTTNCTKSIRSDLNDLVDRFNKLESMFWNIAHMLPDNYVHQEKYEKGNEDLRKFVAETVMQNTIIRKDVVNAMRQQEENCRSMIVELRKEIFSKPSEFPEFQKMIDQKLQIVELNSQNALLRSSNNETHLTLLDRKIESIHLLIKKLDLQKQES